MSGTAVLVLNCGSSSVKFALVEPATGERLLHGLAEKVGSAGTVLRVRRGDDDTTTSPRDGSHAGVVAEVRPAPTTVVDVVEVEPGFN